jgi:hypothetical protein
MRLEFPADAVVVVAGIPGAGKTTLIRRAVDATAMRVVDTQDRRDRGSRGWLRLYAGHYLAIARAVAGATPAVIHSRGTHAASRRLIGLLATLRGRSAHLVLLDVDRASAEAGQRARGRVIGENEMRRQVERWRALVEAAREDRLPRWEAWRSVTVLSRDDARSVHALAAAPLAEVPRRDPLVTNGLRELSLGPPG